MTQTVAEILSEVQKGKPFGNTINTEASQETKPPTKKTEKSSVNPKKDTEDEEVPEKKEEAPLRKDEKGNSDSSNIRSSAENKSSPKKEEKSQKMDTSSGVPIEGKKSSEESAPPTPSSKGDAGNQASSSIESSLENKPSTINENSPPQTSNAGSSEVKQTNEENKSKEGN